MCFFSILHPQGEKGGLSGPAFTGEHYPPACGFCFSKGVQVGRMCWPRHIGHELFPAVSLVIHGLLVQGIGHFFFGKKPVDKGRKLRANRLCEGIGGGVVFQNGKPIWLMSGDTQRVIYDGFAVIRKDRNRIAFDTYGRMIGVTFKSGKELRYEYSKGKGLLTLIIGPTGDKIRLEYNASGATSCINK